MIAYEDVAAALDWLAAAFGFREREETRFTGDDGRITHAEMELEDGVIMLANPTPDYQSPKHHAQVCEQARKWSAVPYVIDGLHVFVEAVDDHFARAKAAGATMLSEPEDQPYGERVYRVEDLEGHRWMFAQAI
jgi:PhnB protein